MTYDIKKNMDCDILILGAGGGGLVAAARAAALSDKKIIVADKAERTGGGAAGAADFRVYGSKWQKDHGCNDKFNEELRSVMDMTYWKLDRKLALRTFRATGQFFDWFCTLGDDIGDRFIPGRYIFDRPDKGPEIPIYVGLPGEKKKAPAAPPPSDAGDDDKPMAPPPGASMKTGSYVMKVMKEQCDKSGVEILLKHRAVDVEIKDGRPVAVIFESEDGYVRIGCKVCILSTGSWINNWKYLEIADPVYAKVDPGKLMPGGHRNSNYTGDGLELAEKMGARIDTDSLVLRPMGPGPKVPFGCSGTMMAMVRSPYSLQINNEGFRYTCEPSVIRYGAFESAHVALYTGSPRSFTVFDYNQVHTAADPKNEIPAQPEGLNEKVTWVVPFTGDVDADLAKDRLAIRADTVEELAEKMQVPYENLKATIDMYNQSCLDGFDSDCFKEPKYLVPMTGPYFAVECSIDTDGAFGGIPVNSDIQAYAADGGLVEGLYVPGDLAAGRYINDMGIKRQIINDLGWAFASAFISAESAVKYLEENTK